MREKKKMDIKTKVVIDKTVKIFSLTTEVRLAILTLSEKDRHGEGTVFKTEVYEELRKYAHWKKTWDDDILSKYFFNVQQSINRLYRTNEISSSMYYDKKENICIFYANKIRLNPRVYAIWKQKTGQ